tara:strand:+ start:7813 stop:8100 length:288 start_codon:yes stop_codon:yes gene_type:complete
VVEYFKTKFNPIKDYHDGHDYIRVINNKDVAIMTQGQEKWLELTNYDERAFVFKRRSGRKRPRVVLESTKDHRYPDYNSYELTEISEAQLVMEVL